MVRARPSALPACPLTWTTVDVASHCVPSLLKVSTLVPWREPCCHGWWAGVLDVGTTGEQDEAPGGSGASPALASGHPPAGAGHVLLRLRCKLRLDFLAVRVSSSVGPRRSWANIQTQGAICTSSLADAVVSGEQDI